MLHDKPCKIETQSSAERKWAARERLKHRCCEALQRQSRSDLQECYCCEHNSKVPTHHWTWEAITQLIGMSDNWSVKSIWTEMTQFLVLIYSVRQSWESPQTDDFTNFHRDETKLIDLLPRHVNNNTDNHKEMKQSEAWLERCYERLTALERSSKNQSDTISFISA